MKFTERGSYYGESNMAFDVEYVAVINSLTIILLQLILSNLVKNRKALPTMLVGIVIGLFGMSMLALSSSNSL